jgi:CRP-like cAMP-binding protein
MQNNTPTPVSTGSEQEIRRLVPLHTLSAECFDSVFAQLQPEIADPGTVLFRQGDPAFEWVYVLGGTVMLRSAERDVETVIGGTDAARIALAHQNPRKLTAVAKSRVRYVRVRPDLVAKASGGMSEPAGYEVRDGADSSAKTGDWMSALLQSPVFLKLPPANLQAVLRAFRELPAKAGEVICRQGEPGESFYIIRSGQCSVAREPKPGARPIRLATLRVWDSFGEYALISGQPHAETVTMDGEGQLLRLDKDKFLKLIREPLINVVGADRALEMAGQHAVWLDLRPPDEATAPRPRGDCRHVPFFSLRTMLPNLDRHRNHICLCDDEGIAAAAAFTLLKSRVPAVVLRGGIDALPAGSTTVDSRDASPNPATSPQGLDFEMPELSLVEEDSAALMGEETRAAVDFLQPETPAAGGVLETGNWHVDENPGLHALGRLESAVAKLYESRERMLQELQTANLSPPARERVPEQAAMQADFLGVRRKLAEAVAAANAAGLEAESLHDYIADLQALVEQFLESGEISLGEEAAALRTELDTVREQAGAELNLLQSRLAAAESENARLRAGLDAVQPQPAAQEQAVEAFGAPGAGPGRTLTGMFLAALAGAVVAAAVILGGLLLEPGRDLARAWLAPASAAAPR